MKNILLLLILLISIPSFAQYSVKGGVIDEEGSPIESGVVTLMDANNGTSLSQALTAQDGSFELKGEGKIQIYVSYMGYRPYFSEPFTLNCDTIIPLISLESDTFNIQELIVLGEKLSPTLKIENGKLIFLPKNSSTFAGVSALEALKKTPGVFISGESNISIGGHNNVLVTINGEQTYLKNEELITLLRTTAAAAIHSIEVMQNPSAKYDSEGSGGIININLERKLKEGFFYIVNNGMSFWNNVRQNTEFSFSYAKNKLSLVGNYNHAFGHYDMWYQMRRIQNGKDYYSDTDDTDKRNTIAGHLNLEYAINDKQTLGGNVSANVLIGPGKTKTTTEISDANTMIVESILRAENDYLKQKGNRYGVNLYYINKPKEGTSYGVEANYAYFDGMSENWQPNTYYSPEGDVTQANLYHSNNHRDIHIFTLGYDQKHPLWGGSLNSGVKYSSVNSDNGNRFYYFVDNQEIFDEFESNDFIYKEQILAAYMQYARPIGDRWNMELGLRGEYTFSKNTLLTINSVADQRIEDEYLNLFPNFRLGYKINKGSALTLGYSSRIDRPSYQDLNPFMYLIDELSGWKGNHLLKPQVVHRVALNYTVNKTSVTADYTYIQDYKARVTEKLSPNKVAITTRNVGKQQKISLSVFQSIKITDWWETRLNVTGYYVKNMLALNKVRYYNFDDFAGIFSVQNTFHLPWQIQCDLNGFYATEHLGGTKDVIASTGYVDIGFGKNINNKWSVKLACTDVFATTRRNNYTFNEGFEIWNWFKGETRQVKINVTYKFGKLRKNSHNNNFNEIDRL